MDFQKSVGTLMSIYLIYDRRVDTWRGLWPCRPILQFSFAYRLKSLKESTFYRSDIRENLMETLVCPLVLCSFQCGLFFHSTCMYKL